ncbi:hypothetical protein FKW77_010112 [Venturia effusa]|uniref:NAD(P)-binding protein n=1 Tax=Venturia effusa TaxID=50376 RepID=A0A517L8A7_9PEZI|nr:hypothetical protein FKW77_010112 [Venturia effusa]
MSSIMLQFCGLLSLSAVVYRVSTFINLYFLRASTIDRYLCPGDETWALITGATQGVGLSLAQQLLDRGFNVVLHSRDPEKLAKKTRQLESQYPHRQCLWVAGDAADVLPTVAKLRAAIEKIEAEGGKFRILVNNVGGAGLFGVPMYMPFMEVPSEVAAQLLDLNAKFPTLLSRALLPMVAANEPALVLNISSYAGVYGDPYISIFAATKAFNNILSKSLSYEMRVLHPSVEVLGLVLGGVLTPGNPDEKLGFASLTPDEVARNIIDRVGCGKSVCAASWKQCLLGESAKWMPEALARWALTREVQKRMEWEKGRKAE